MICSRARGPVRSRPILIPRRNNTTYVPHAYPKDEAIRRIMRHEQNRWLAPFENEFPKKEGIVLSDEDPVSKVLYSTMRMRAKVRRIKFDAQVGYPHIDQVITTNHEGKTEIRTEHRLRYTYVGFTTLDDPLYYGSRTRRFTIAACNYMYDEMVEKAFDKINFKSDLQEYTPHVKQSVDKVYDFDLTYADAMTIARSRMLSMQKERAIREIFKRFGGADVQIIHFEMDADIELSSHLLPAYEWKPTPKMPPVILSALKQSDRIVGGGLLSPTKLGGLAMAVTTVASFFFPPLRAGIIAAGAAGMVFGLKGREWQHAIREKMHEFSKGEMDDEGRVKLKRKKKRSEQEKIEGTGLNERSEGVVLDVDRKYFEALGLNPKEGMTREKILKAFHDAIMKAHVDHGGSTEKTREVLVARKILLDALNG